MIFEKLSSTEIIKRNILEYGFSYQSDSIIEKRVDAIAERNFSFKIEEDLDFYKLSTINDEISRNTL